MCVADEIFESIRFHRFDSSDGMNCFECWIVKCDIIGVISNMEKQSDFSLLQSQLILNDLKRVLRLVSSIFPYLSVLEEQSEWADIRGRYMYPPRPIDVHRDLNNSVSTVNRESMSLKLYPPLVHIPHISLEHSCTLSMILWFYSLNVYSTKNKWTYDDDFRGTTCCDIIYLGTSFLDLYGIYFEFIFRY